jgi:hypothetical protein
MTKLDLPRLRALIEKLPRFSEYPVGMMEDSNGWYIEIEAVLYLLEEEGRRRDRALEAADALAEFALAEFARDDVFCGGEPYRWRQGLGEKLGAYKEARALLEAEPAAVEEVT